jgi:hypothetical protein
MDSSQYTQPAPCLPIFLSLLLVPAALCQTTQPSNQSSPKTGEANRALAPQTVPPQEQLPRRIFGVIPNYRSHASLQNSKPLTSGQKFRLAARDTFDPGTFLLTGVYAGIGQASNSSPSYGQGMAGYGHYYGSAFGDIMAGNFMTEAIYPSIFHQDPRYFRRGTGSTWSRLKYACGQIFVTHGDNRKTQFNISEIGGNATAVAISQSWDPDNRTVGDAARKYGVQLGLDMAGNVLKEFAPDLYRTVVHKKHPPAYQGKP